MKTITTRGLPGGGGPAATYTFYLREPRPLVVLEIPGDWGGPDNCWPKFPEQEEWLNGLSLRMKQTWDCQWTFEDAEAVEEFLALLAPFTEEPAA
jgi:hypothetical protein